MNIDGEDFVFSKFINVECLHQEIEIIVDMETLFSKNYNQHQCQHPLFIKPVQRWPRRSWGHVGPKCQCLVLDHSDVATSRCRCEWYLYHLITMSSSDVVVWKWEMLDVINIIKYHGVLSNEKPAQVLCVLPQPSVLLLQGTHLVINGYNTAFSCLVKPFPAFKVFSCLLKPPPFPTLFCPSDSQSIHI